MPEKDQESLEIINEQYQGQVREVFAENIK